MSFTDENRKQKSDRLAEVYITPLLSCALTMSLLLFNAAVFMPIYVLDRYPSVEQG